ncbi:MAG: N-acetylmuramoyl-L-alanine amidase [Oscillospiraceae bacterium]|nr:N-acetylmuramoyl-L-alanine amidase [Oscillospiraceae bacterium]
MEYTNSPLVSCVKLSPNHSGQRTHDIDTITVHCVVGQCSAETIGSIFAPESRQASSNYGVGYDGKIGMYVEEKNRSWCTSSRANDQRAITIEVASGATEPYAFNDAAYTRLIELCIDICKRNGKNKVIWFGDKDKTLAYEPADGEMVLTVHRWFANKSCPGSWMYARMDDLASKVNAALSNTTNRTLYRVQVGAYYKKENAENMLAKLKAAGFDGFIATVEAEQEEAPKQEVKPEAPKVTLKSIDEIAREVIRGNWGNGQDRVNRLKAAGYDPKKVQDRVNELC